METEIETGQLLTEVRIIFSGLLKKQFFQIKKKNMEPESEETGSPSFTSEEVNFQYQKAKEKFIPEKSKQKYNQFFFNFWEYLKQNYLISNKIENNNISSLEFKKVINAKVLLAYFNLLSNNCAPSTLWSTYSCLKKTLSVHSIDIARCPELSPFMKANSRGYVPDKSLKKLLLF